MVEFDILELVSMWYVLLVDKDSSNVLIFNNFEIGRQLIDVKARLDNYLRLIALQKALRVVQAGGLEFIVLCLHF